MPIEDDGWKAAQRRWGAAIRDRLTETGRSQEWLATELGVSQSTVTSWINATFEVRPRAAFAIERILGLPAGAASQLLGYVPAGTVMRSVSAVIEADPGLTPQQAEDLVVMHETMLARTQARRLARGDRP